MKRPGSHWAIAPMFVGTCILGAACIYSVAAAPSQPSSCQPSSCQQWTIGAPLPVQFSDAPTSQRRVDRYRWYDLRPDQLARLTEALRAVPLEWHTPVLILCDPVADCLSLAQDFDTAFEDAGWESRIDKPFDVVDGLHCAGNEDACNVVSKATGIKMVIDAEGVPATLVLNFGRKTRR